MIHSQHTMLSPSYMIKSRFYHTSTHQPKSVTCDLCPHHCCVGQNKTGRCSTRLNLGGVLYAINYGKLVAACPDPVEKKPLYHFNPGHQSYSIASAGCNFKCRNCQNSSISQQKAMGLTCQETHPNEIILAAQKSNCHSISFTYTEPTTLFEYIHDVATLALKQNLNTIMVSNGYMSNQCIEALAPLIHAINIDLKSMSSLFYREFCHGELEPVLNTILNFHRLGVHVELTTLLIPGMNDSSQELNEIADFIHSVHPHIPWHISRFHPAYRLSHLPPTSTTTLLMARHIGTLHGLQHVYIGNAPEIKNHTKCSQCNTILIRRDGFLTNMDNLQYGACGQCGFPLFGMFP